MMKKSLLFISTMGLLLLSSCGDVFDLDELDDPNSPTPEQANFEAVYNSTQLDFEDILMDRESNPDGRFGLFQSAQEMSRHVAFTTGNDYADAYQASNFDYQWIDFYGGFLPDAKLVYELGVPLNRNVHTASVRVLEAYLLSAFADNYGSVPYTEAGQGLDVLSPGADSGESLYARAHELLDLAIEELTGTTAASPTIDNFYQGNAGKWLKAANSLKMRLYLNTSLVDGSAGSNIMQIVSGGDFIESSDDDWQFNYAANRAGPDARHPYYNDWYESQDGDYMSNYFMWLMNEEKGLQDPRIRSYFYRQEPSIPLDDINIFDCIHSPLPDAAFTPAHYLAVDANMPYCAASISDGYYGRDHGNGNGIPPDGIVRTVYGVYPGGGKFDNNSFEQSQQEGVLGAQGEGIIPMILASFVDFYRAEAAISLGTGEDARALLESGVRKSIAKVIAFTEEKEAASLTEVVGTDINGNPIFGSIHLPNDEAVDAYVARVLELYDASSDKLDVVAKEFLIASFGNGLEGYNLVRRTCRPNNLQPTILTSGGSFARSMYYPAVYVNRNQSASQKASVTEAVFWDTNPADCIP